jgi:DNA-binding NtrC family response regulator
MAMQLLMDYRWPGNVRELRNFAQAITLFCEGGVIDRRSVESYFGSRLVIGRQASPGHAPEKPSPLRPPRPLADVERAEIAHALGYHEGNVSEAARSLGMGRATLYKYIKRENLDPDALAREAAEARARQSGPAPES